MVIFLANPSGRLLRVISPTNVDTKYWNILVFSHFYFFYNASCACHIFTNKHYEHIAFVNLFFNDGFPLSLWH